MILGDDKAGLAVRAMWYMGKGSLTKSSVQTATREFRRSDRNKFKHISALMPAWLSDFQYRWWNEKTSDANAYKQLQVSALSFWANTIEQHGKSIFGEGNFRRHLKNAQHFLLGFVCEEKCRLCGATLSYSEKSLPWEEGMLGQTSEMQRMKGKSNLLVDAADTICNACWRGLTEQSCVIATCSVGENIIFPVASATRYDAQMKRLICRFKDSSDRLLSRDLAKLMSRAAYMLIQLFEEELSPILVPVPLHRWRKLKRGFNQSELLAKELGKIVGWTTDCQALVRVKATPCQKQLTKTERLDNLQGAFKGSRARLSGKNIILVDDISTSGATLAECAKEVFNCNADRVFALTVAKALLHRCQ